MAEPTSILPLEYIKTMCTDIRLVSPEYLDESDSSYSMRMAFDLLDAIRNGRQPCEATAQWFDSSLTKWITGEANHLQEAFCLSRQEAKKLRHHIQTIHLRAAFDLVYCEKPGRKARAEKLADEIRRFENYFGDPLPVSPLPDWSGVRVRIWCARKFGPLPKSWERITDGCKQ